MTTVTVQAPAGVSGQVQAAATGNVYNLPSAGGQIAIDERDVMALVRAGWTVITAGAGALAASEMASANIPINDATGGTPAAPVVDVGGINTTGI